MVRRAWVVGPAGVVLASCLLIVLPVSAHPGGAATPRAVQAPPKSRSSTPAVAIRPCLGPEVRWGDGGDNILDDYDAGGEPVAGTIICARGGDDEIEVGGAGTIVWAGSGDDAIYSASPAGRRTPQYIVGEAGTDTVQRDRIDTFVQGSFKASRRLSGRLLGAAGVTEYPAREPAVQCIDNQGFWQMYFEPEPRMRPVDATSQVDWGFVAWSAVLTKWDGQAWQFSLQNEWLWDFTYDRQVTYFPGNTWRRYGNNASPELDPTAGSPWRLWFNITEPGYYRVAVYFYHYPTTALPSNRIYDWVDFHRGQFARSNGTYDFCAFGV